MKILILLIFSICLSQGLYANNIFETPYNDEIVQKVAWQIPPKIELPDTLKDKYYAHNDMILQVKFLTDIDGTVQQALIVNSTGDTELDSLIKSAFLNAKIKPHKMNGAYISIIGVQPVEIKFPKCPINLRIFKRCVF